MPRTEELDVIRRWGANATCWQIFNPGVRRWMDSKTKTLIGFRRILGGTVVVGDPIGPPESLLETVNKFETLMGRVVYFGTSLDTYHRLQTTQRHVGMPIGFQTVLIPSQWNRIKNQKSSLAYQIRRSHHKGTVVRPAAGSDFIQIKECVEKWQSQKKPLKLYFMTDPQIAIHSEGRRQWIAKNGDRIVGTLVATPIPAENGWLLEQWIRHPDAPNGTIEHIIDEAISQLYLEGAQRITMGLCPLAESVHHPLPAIHKFTFTIGKIATAWFYRPTSLTKFKLKFMFPLHEPIYAVFSSKWTLPLSFFDISLAFMIPPTTIETL